MRYLVFCSTALGDLAIEIATLNSIARNGHHLEVIASRRSASLLEDCDFIDKVDVHRDKLDVILNQPLYIAKRFQKWDAVLLMSTKWYRKLLCIPYFVGCRRTGKDMDHQLPTILLMKLSILDGLIDDWRDPIDTQIPFSATKLVQANQVAGVDATTKILTVAPGGGANHKLWPVANFIEVVNKLKHDYAKVLVIGSAKETELCETLASATGANNLAGKLSLTQLAALLSKVSLHIGNDSGVGHVAAGAGTKRVLAIGGGGTGSENEILTGVSDKRFAPWKQEMLTGRVSQITPASVLEKLTS